MRKEQKQMQFDNGGEELFYDFLNDFELTSMIKGIESQVWIETNPRRRVDFVLTLTNGEKIYIEVDGKTHDDAQVWINDERKDMAAYYRGIHTIRISFKDFFEHWQTREEIANEIQDQIEFLSSI